MESEDEMIKTDQDSNSNTNNNGKLNYQNPEIK